MYLLKKNDIVWQYWVNGDTWTWFKYRMLENQEKELMDVIYEGGGNSYRRRGETSTVKRQQLFHPADYRSGDTFLAKGKEYTVLDVIVERHYVKIAAIYSGLPNVFSTYNSPEDPFNLNNTVPVKVAVKGSYGGSVVTTEKEPFKLCSGDFLWKWSTGPLKWRKYSFVEESGYSTGAARLMSHGFIDSPKARPNQIVSMMKNYFNPKDSRAGDVFVHAERKNVGELEVTYINPNGTMVVRTLVGNTNFIIVPNAPGITWCYNNLIPVRIKGFNYDPKPVNEELQLQELKEALPKDASFSIAEPGKGIWEQLKKNSEPNYPGEDGQAFKISIDKNWLERPAAMSWYKSEVERALRAPWPKSSPVKYSDVIPLTPMSPEKKDALRAQYPLTPKDAYNPLDLGNLFDI